ncbi:MAG TPA: hypothetical protein VNG12_22190 [Acidimicrobiales bacterium]|nr:hypothetical protein [Acidimicrobiales bacterium]
MHKLASGLAGLIVSGGGLILAVPAGATPPPPMFQTPCGQSAETGTAPTSPTPNLDLGPAGGSGSAIGIWGANGYLEVNGNQSTLTGGISGDLYSGGNQLYGGVSGSAGSGSGNVCVGSVGTSVSQAIP